MERVVVTLIASVNPPIDWVPMDIILCNSRDTFCIQSFIGIDGRGRNRYGIASFVLGRHCGKAHGDLSEPLTIESNGVQRQFLVYVPESYQEEQATGLMSFHGYGKDMWNQQEISRFNDSTFN